MFTDDLNRRYAHADYDAHPGLRRAPDGGIDCNYYRTKAHRERALAIRDAAGALGRLFRRAF